MAKVDDVASSLQPFLSLNPLSDVAEEESGHLVIRMPWADSSLTLDLGDGEDDGLLEQLNKLYLPSRFSALFHDDEKSWEFIFVAYTDGMSTDPHLDDRAFDFSFDGSTYSCHWGTSSDSLLALARIARPSGAPVGTAYRNLPNYNRYVTKLDKYQGQDPESDIGVALSFWVKPSDIELEPNEEVLVKVARHLNFYMNFYDQRSPLVRIHEEQHESAFNSIPRLKHGDFPPSMNGRELDPYLLGLWEASILEPDASLRFLYNYQVLEYAAFFHLKQDTMHKVRRLLATPDVCARPEATAQRMVELMSVESNRQEDDKLVDLLREVVDPCNVWPAVEANIAFFAAPTIFDGGYSLDGLLPKEECDLEYFKQHWLPKFATSIRRLRNALVHARDSRGDGRLAPSAANSAQIRFWIEPIQAVVADVMLYGYTASQETHKE